MDLETLLKNFGGLIVAAIGFVFWLGRLRQRTDELERDIDSVKESLKSEVAGIKNNMTKIEERRENQRREDNERLDRRFSELREDVKGLGEIMREIAKNG